jgi:hypothetical protein
MSMMSSEMAEVPSRPSQMTQELEKQSTVLSELLEQVTQLEHRLSPVLRGGGQDKAMLAEVAEKREQLVPYADMVHNGTEIVIGCVNRLRTILNTLEV